jgi:tRNA modification GTPase
MIGVNAAETVVACLTPPGVGAIATVAIRGPTAWTLARSLFRPASKNKPELPEQAEPGQFWFGRWGDGLADEAVLTLKQHEPAPWLELHVHGGREVIRWLLETLAERGVRTCTWQEFHRATEENPARAAAWIALAEAPTARTAAILLDQYHGAFSRALAAVDDALGRNALEEATRRLSELARHTSLRRHLTTPWRVVIAGAPNVGKSSLLNAIAGFQRCIVSEAPGTTRDVVWTRLAIDGWPVEMADTAGLRAAAEALEGAGVGRAREAAREADLRLWVLDAAAEPAWPDDAIGDVKPVVNKIDLPPAWDLNLCSGAVSGPCQPRCHGQETVAQQALRVSALTGDGVPELCDTISRWLVPSPPAAGDAVPFLPVLCDRLDEIRTCLTNDRLKEARDLLRLTIERCDGEAVQG